MHATAPAPAARREMSPLTAGLLTIGTASLALFAGLLAAVALVAGAAFAAVTAVMGSL